MSEPLHGNPSFIANASGRRRWKGVATALLDLRRVLRCRRERHYLAEMDARLLRDIGADRNTAASEARKWWWQA
ncbi:MAG TPA: hypothetical protein VNR89_05680 [Roseomonas sp.]|nr:hypothetical protein [Roseomonas sp.]